jgi:hypothetical protein
MISKVLTTNCVDPSKAEKHVARFNSVLRLAAKRIAAMAGVRRVVDKSPGRPAPSSENVATELFHARAENPTANLPPINR